jgi:hypothetical protein
MQELFGRQRSSLRSIFIFDPEAATLLSQVLAQQLPGERIQQSDLRGIPLHLDAATDPARRGAVVGGPTPFRSDMDRTSWDDTTLTARRCTQWQESGRHEQSQESACGSKGIGIAPFPVSPSGGKPGTHRRSLRSAG